MKIEAVLDLNNFASEKFLYILHILTNTCHLSRYYLCFTCHS